MRLFLLTIICLYGLNIIEATPAVTTLYMKVTLYLDHVYIRHDYDFFSSEDIAVNATLSIKAPSGDFLTQESQVSNSYLGCLLEPECADDYEKCYFERAFVTERSYALQHKASYRALTDSDDSKTPIFTVKLYVWDDDTVDCEWESHDNPAESATRQFTMRRAASELTSLFSVPLSASAVLPPIETGNYDIDLRGTYTLAGTRATTLTVHNNEVLEPAALGVTARFDCEQLVVSDGGTLVLHEAGANRVHCRSIVLRGYVLLRTELAKPAPDVRYGQRLRSDTPVQLMESASIVVYSALDATFSPAQLLQDQSITEHYAYDIVVVAAAPGSSSTAATTTVTGSTGAATTVTGSTAPPYTGTALSSEATALVATSTAKGGPNIGGADTGAKDCSEVRDCNGQGICTGLRQCACFAPATPHPEFGCYDESAEMVANEKLARDDTQIVLPASVAPTVRGNANALPAALAAALMIVLLC